MPGPQGFLSNPFVPVAAFAGVDASVNQASSVITLGSFKNIGIQFFWIGTPTGTIVVKVSNDTFYDVVANQQWIALTLTGLTPSFTQPAGSTSQQWLDVQTNAFQMQLTYTASTGAGKLYAYLMGKP